MARSDYAPSVTGCRCTSSFAASTPASATRSICDPIRRSVFPGLVDVCRAGHVSVVNTLGSGVLENAALAGLMGALSKHFLGERPHLGLGAVMVVRSTRLADHTCWPTSARSWCGRSHARRSSTRSTRPAPALLELEHVRRRIVARPDQWVGQERMTTGSSPVLTSSGIEARPTVLRTFAVADGDSYIAMPGGLARASTGDLGSAICQPNGRRLEGHLGTRGRSSESGRVLVRRARPSCARADRYPPGVRRRASVLARPLRRTRRGNSPVDPDDQRPPGRVREHLARPGPASLNVLLEALTRITGTYPGFVGDDAAALLADPANELFSLVVDEHRPGSVAHAIHHMFAAIDVLRDQLSVDTWLVVGSLLGSLERLASETDDRTAYDRDEATRYVLDALLQSLLSLSGLANESMVRDHGWQFMETGRRIERAMHVTVLVGSRSRSEHSAPVESLLVESVLIAGESIITSRRRYRSRAVAATTIDLLFGERATPDRSVSKSTALRSVSPCSAVIARSACRRPRCSCSPRSIIWSKGWIRLGWQASTTWATDPSSIGSSTTFGPGFRRCPTRSGMTRSPVGDPSTQWQVRSHDLRSGAHNQLRLQRSSGVQFRGDPTTPG